jgi:hypothetical protein
MGGCRDVSLCLDLLTEYTVMAMIRPVPAAASIVIMGTLGKKTRPGLPTIPHETRRAKASNAPDFERFEIDRG